MFVILFVIDGVMLNGSFLVCVFCCACVCGCVRVVFKAFVDIVCDCLRGVVGFRVRACCVVFVRVLRHVCRCVCWCVLFIVYRVMVYDLFLCILCSCVCVKCVCVMCS